MFLVHLFFVLINLIELWQILFVKSNYNKQNSGPLGPGLAVPWLDEQREEKRAEGNSRSSEDWILCLLADFLSEQSGTVIELFSHNLFLF